jgi:tetratricopeptide (TPR) repeat protein
MACDAAGLAAQGGPVDARRAFRLLGLWEGPDIGLPGAAALLGVPEDQAADALDVLIDAHLLEQATSDRYRFHDLLRAYAAERAEAEEPKDDQDAAIRRIVTWYLHTAEAGATVISPNYGRVPLDDVDPACHPLSFASLDDALNWCETERLNLAAATRLAADRGLHEIAWKLPAASMSFFYRRSHLADWTSTHQIGLASARKLAEKRAEAWMLNSLGIALYEQRLGDAVDCLERALAIRQEIGDRDGEARTANNLGAAYEHLGQLEQAVDTLQRSLIIQREIGHRFGEGIALAALGEAYRRQGHTDRAIECMNKAQAIFHEVGEPSPMGSSLNDLAQAYLDLSRTDDAINALRKALEIHRAMGDRHDEADGLKRLGAAQLQADRPREAREAWTRAYKIFGELGDQEQRAEVRARLDVFGRQ